MSWKERLCGEEVDDVRNHKTLSEWRQIIISIL